MLLAAGRDDGRGYEVDWPGASPLWVALATAMRGWDDAPGRPDYHHGPAAVTAD